MTSIMDLPLCLPLWTASFSKDSALGQVGAEMFLGRMNHLTRKENIKVIYEIASKG